MNEESLKSFLLQVHISVLESLLLKLHLVTPLATKTVSSIDASLQLTMQVLEDTAKETEKIFLSAEFCPRQLTDEERSLVADETRDMLESMKKHASRLAGLMTKIGTS